MLKETWTGTDILNTYPVRHIYKHGQCVIQARAYSIFFYSGQAACDVKGRVS